MSSPMILITTILVAYFPASTHAHGRMLSPVSRMSGYLAGLAMPANYNDNEMNCGGRVVQWQENGGKCGICGDPWQPTPRPYERPYGAAVQGATIITGEYLENQAITIKIQLTANHKGWMEFRVCDVAKSGGIEATHDCLDQNLLADEFGQTRFPLTESRTGMFEYIVVLPEGLTCEHCVLQWYWKCGNDWGCDSSRCCVGCGEVQEEFYACSDITIKSRGIRYPTTTQRPTTPTTTTTTTTATTTTTTQRPTTRRPTFRPTIRTPTTPTTTTSTTTPRPPTTTTTTTTTPRPTTTTTTRKPTNIFNSPSAWMDYLKKLRNPNSGTSVQHQQLPIPQQQQPPATNTNTTSSMSDDQFLEMILGGSGGNYEVHDGQISVPMIKNTGEPNTATLSQNEKDRLCASCTFSCRFNSCYTECPEVCVAFGSRNRPVG